MNDLNFPIGTVSGGSFTLAGVTWFHESDHRKLEAQAVQHREQILTQAKTIESLKAELAEAGKRFSEAFEIYRDGNTIRDAETGECLGYLIGPSEAKAAPSLPAVDSPDDLTPELLGLAADVILAANPTVPIESTEFGVANELRLLRDRLEREQAEKAKRDNLVGLLATAIVQFENSRYDHSVGEIPSPTPIDYANAILDRFDITPKAAGE